MLRRGRDAAAGLILGAVFAIKPTIGPLLLMLLWIGCYQTVLWSAAAAIAVVLEWPGVARAFVARPSTGVTADRTARRLAIAAGICLSLLATPIAEDHQFVLLAIPIFILAADAPELRVGWSCPCCCSGYRQPGRGNGLRLDGGFCSRIRACSRRGVYGR